MIPSIISTLISTLVLVWVYAWLTLTTPRRKYLALLTAGWAGALAKSICELAMMSISTGVHPHLLAWLNCGQMLGALANGFFILWGTLSFLEKRIRWQGVALAALVGVWVVGSTWANQAATGASRIVPLIYLQASPFVRNLVVYELLAAIMIWSGLLFLRRSRATGPEKYMAAALFIVWGLHRADYPFVQASSISSLQVAGYLTASGLQIATAVAVLLLFFKAITLERERSDRRYRMLVDHAPDAIYLLVDGRFAYVNPATLRLFGADRPEQLLRRSILDFVHPEFHAEVQRRLECHARNEVTAPTEQEIRRLDGQSVPVEVVSTPCEFAGQQGAQVMVRDITNRKRVQDALRQSQQFVEQVVNTTPDLLYIYDLVERRNVYANREITRVLGYLPDQMTVLGIHLFETLLHPEDRLAVEQHHRTLRGAADGTVLRLEYRMKHADGQWRWLRSKDTVFARGADGICRQIIGTAVDITDQRHAEESLRASEKKLRLAVEAAALETWEVDLTSRRGSVSDDRLLGSQPETYEDFLKVVLPADRPLVAKAIEQVVARPDSHLEVEFRVLGAKGELRWIAAHGNAVRDRAGQAIKLTGVHRDVTERHLAAETLDAFFTRSPAGLTILDEQLRFVRINEMLADINGAAVDAHLGKTLAQMVPELAPTLESVYRRIMQTGEPMLNLAITGQTPKHPGETRHWISSYFPLKSADGKARYLGAVIVEITEQKRAEEALRQSEEHYRQAAEANRRLLEEVNHRVRNNLGALLSLLELIQPQATDVASFAQAMRTRIHEMATIHNLLSSAGWRDYDLRTLLEGLIQRSEHLAPYRASVGLEGPDVVLGPGKVVPLSMAVLELLTNSCKYGVHSQPGGQLHLSWTVADGNSLLQMKWRETGGPAVAASATPSLGSELVAGFVNHELGGRCRLQFSPDGADHFIEFPLDAMPAAASGRLEAPADKSLVESDRRSLQ